MEDVAIYRSPHRHPVELQLGVRQGDPSLLNAGLGRFDLRLGFILGSDFVGPKSQLSLEGVPSLGERGRFLVKRCLTPVQFLEKCFGGIKRVSGFVDDTAWYGTLGRQLALVVFLGEFKLCSGAARGKR